MCACSHICGARLDLCVYMGYVSVDVCVYTSLVYVCVMSHVCISVCVCARLCVPKECGSACRDQQDPAGWVPHTILSGPEAGAWVGVGEPWEPLGPGPGPGSGSRPDGGPAPHTAS